MSSRPGPAPGHDRAAVAWLTAQSVLFGAMAALLGVVANALFLAAYGSSWLPATYVAIGAAGVVLSAVLARATQRFDLIELAVAVLGGATVLFVASWLVTLQPGGAWVSIPLLVLFPILLQLGFVFIGGQAGRILDIAGIKASFPRIMTGFPVGAVAGGLLGVPLVDLLGRSEDLLLATAAAQAGFTALVWLTGRRYASRLVLAPANATTGGDRPTDAALPGEPARPSLVQLLRARFVALILAYQVLSALGSQVSDFLVFDRANAAFSGATDLARFVSGYTAVMNGLTIAFLYLAAGPLLRRFGLRLGLASNPLVVTVFAVAMVLVLAIAGADSVALLAVVAGTRIADIALTDGTTRTSINALYQVIPPRPRLAVQTAVEGMGVPLAIGLSGALILVVQALPNGLALTVAALGVVCAAWAWIALRLYAAYGPALGDALRRTRLLDPDASLEASLEDAAVARGLVLSGDTRAARLGIELTSLLPADTLAAELEVLASDPRPEVRLTALAEAARGSDQATRRRLAAEVRDAATARDATVRGVAASASAALDAGDRMAVAALLVDTDPGVRNAALAAVQPGDRWAVDRAVAALDDVRTARAAGRAVAVLGDDVLPRLAIALDDGSTPPAFVRRFVRAAGHPSPARDAVLLRHIAHPDRLVALAVLERLGDREPGGTASDMGARAAALDRVIGAELEHSARILAARVALAAPDAVDARAEDASSTTVSRALDDELALVQSTIVSALVARHGAARVATSLRRLAGSDDDASLALEALEVALGRDMAARAVALVVPGRSARERLHALIAAGVADPPSRDAMGWLRDIVEDVEGRWRSSWLLACALRAVRLRPDSGDIDLRVAAASADAAVREELAAGGR